MAGSIATACSSRSSDDGAARPDASPIAQGGGRLTDAGSASDAEALTTDVETTDLDASTDDGTTTTDHSDEDTDAATTNAASDAATLPNDGGPHPKPIDAAAPPQEGTTGATTDAAPAPPTSDAAADASIRPDPTLDASAALPDGAAPPNADAPGSSFDEFDGGANRYFTEVENNDDLEVANDLGYGSANVVGEVYPTNDWDYFRFELRHPSSVTLRLHDTSDDPNLQGCEESPLGIALLRANETVVATGSSLDNCPAIDWRLDDAARNLPAGIYYVRVRASSTLPRVEEYRLEVNYVAECGNGLLEAAETCDDDSCPDCRRDAACGDGFVDLPNEGCEDEGPNDGCDAQCHPEYVSEIEPNDSNADALARANTDNLIIGADALVGGSIGAPDDIDRWVIRTPQDSIVFVSVFDTASAAACVGEDRMQPSLWDAGDTLVRGYWPLRCGWFAANLPSGDHFLVVEEPLEATVIPTHRVEVDFVELAGSEDEPGNNSASTAAVLALVPGASTALSASAASGDEDWYVLQVPARYELVVDTLPDSWTSSRCDPEQLDTELAVFDEFGVELDSSDLAEDGSECGKLAVPNRLAETTPSYVRVTPGGFGPNAFDYRIVFKLRLAGL